MSQGHSIVSGVHGYVFTGHLFCERGNIVFSYPSTVGILPQRNFQAGILQNFLCNHTQSRTFCSTLRSSQISSEVTTHPWK